MAKRSGKEFVDHVAECRACGDVSKELGCQAYSASCPTGSSLHGLVKRAFNKALSAGHFVAVVAGEGGGWYVKCDCGEYATAHRLRWVALASAWRHERAILASMKARRQRGFDGMAQQSPKEVAC